MPNPPPPNPTTADFGGHFAAYAAAHLIFPTAAPPLEIPLSRQASRAEMDALQRLHPCGFAVVTAYNPRGRVLSRAANERRHARLAATLLMRGVPLIPADGRSADGRHREAGFLLPNAIGRDVAMEFEQLAFYVFDGNCFWLHGALLAEAAVRLPADPPREKSGPAS